MILNFVLNNNLMALRFLYPSHHKHSMESMAYFHRIYGIVPWNPLNFNGINGKNLWHFMNFHNFLLLVYLPSTAMETLKTPSEYSVNFNRGFQGFSMANLETGGRANLTIVSIILHKYQINVFSINTFSICVSEILSTLID